MQKIKGASWPYEINLKKLFQKEVNLHQNYNTFCDQSNIIFNKICTVKPHLLSEFLFNLATCEDVINNVKKVIGPNVNIWSSAFFSKSPNSTKYVGFHQDSPYWQLSSNNVVTAWIALTASNKSNGCLQFIDTGKEEFNTYPIEVDDAYEAYKRGEKTSPNEDLISFKQKLPKDLEMKDRYFVELKPGQFSLHTIDVIHGSSQNTSSLPRIGFAVRYIDSNTYHLRDSLDSVLNVCGEYSQYMAKENPPLGEFSKYNIDNYKEGIKRAGAFGNKSY
tara:strand:- start:310 stop:1137 length:828 start_codon:yes stop_codon:yes gene_type:complete